MNEKGVALKGFFLFFLFLAFVCTASLTVYGYYFFKKQGEKIKAKEAEIQVLKEKQTELDGKLKESQQKEKDLQDEKEELQRSIKKYEDEKTTIMKEMDDSLAGFEIFRKNIVVELDRLSHTVGTLENEKKTLIKKVEVVETRSKNDRTNLVNEISKLEGRISEHKKNEKFLSRTLEKKERDSIVLETTKLHYNLGNFYFRNKEYTKAADEYKKALAYQPTDPDANYNLAVVYDECLNNRLLAIEYYKKYLRLSPGAMDYKKIEERVVDLELQDRVLSEDMDAVHSEKKELDKNKLPILSTKLANIEMAADKK